MHIKLIDVPLYYGCDNPGTHLAPMTFSKNQIASLIEERGHHLDRLSIVPTPQNPTDKDAEPTMKYLNEVTYTCRQLADCVHSGRHNGQFPLVIGGDHALGLGSIAGLARSIPADQLSVIWIDAHGDWNSEESTCTGNMHGMPFSAVCGYGPDCMVEFGQGAAPVNVAHCVQVGGRDIDDLERQRMAQAGVTVFPINMIDKLGMGAVIERAIQIAGEGTDGIHLSFDVDAITPEAVPGTGVIVYNGLTPREAFLAAEAIAESRKLISMDMVEVNPFLDTANKSGILASELIQSALGKSVY